MPKVAVTRRNGASARGRRWSPRHTRASANHSFGSAGNGVAAHITGAAFARAVGGSAEHVPYRGEVAALTDLIAGRLTFQAPSLTSAIPMVEAGKAIALGVTHETRVPQLPNVPTMAEAGFPEFVKLLYTAWLSLEVRKDTPKPVEDRLREALNDALQDPVLRAQFNKVGAVEMPIRNGEETQKLIDELAVQIGPVVRDSGAKAE